MKIIHQFLILTTITLSNSMFCSQVPAYSVTKHLEGYLVKINRAPHNNSLTDITVTNPITKQSLIKWFSLISPIEGYETSYSGDITQPLFIAMKHYEKNELRLYNKVELGFINQCE